MPPSLSTRTTLPVAPQSSPLGVYLHVPFCGSICRYCNFTRGLLDEALKATYVEALITEIDRHADGSAVDTIYFGGGTPSVLDSAEIAALVRACRDAFDVDPACEVTLEANPEDVTPQYLAALRAAGVSRLSLGVQSFQDAELGRLGRRHSAARASAAVRDARGAGFDDVSLDLMMWLPQQDVGAWLVNVETLIALAPEHASLYLLELYPGAPLRDEMARAGWQLAPDETAAEMYLRGLEMLEVAGYQHYEISNVARDGRFARHNLKYWTDGEWLGLGCGAHGTRAGRRWRNVSSPQDYVDRVRAGVSARAESHTLTATDRVSEALITGLRLAGGVDLAAMRARHGVDVLERHGASLEPCRDAGLVTFDDSRLRLTRAGMLLANEVMAVFV